MTWWDPHVEEIKDVDTYLRRKFRQDVTDRTTGLTQAGIAKRFVNEDLESCYGEIAKEITAQQGK